MSCCVDKCIKNSALVLMADIKSNLSKNSILFNISQFRGVMHIHIPVNLMISCDLVSIEEIELSTEPLELDEELVDVVSYDGCHPWIDITVDNLNDKVGYHLYMITFIDKITSDTHYIYFEYVIQNENCEKPYVYMERDK